MLAIPLKKGLEVDFVSPLYANLSEKYGEGKATAHFDSFSSIRAQREKFLHLSVKSPTASDLETASSYLRMLAIVESKFDLTEERGLAFTWFDAFQLNKSLSYTRLAGERACCLFNFAALHSRLAINLDRAEDGQLNQASAMFAIAATLFKFLKDNYLPDHPVGAKTTDLSNEGLSMLIELMLAQSQVCFFERAARNKLSPAILSKLAQGAAELFQKAFLFSQTSVLQTVLADSWGYHLTFQVLRFRAEAARYFAASVYARASQEAEGYGEHIAWLIFCRDLANQARQFAADKRLPNSVLKPINSLQEGLQKELDKSIEDNRNIYMETVPAASSLSKLDSHISAKADMNRIESFWKGPIGLSEQVEGDIFFGLLPFGVERAVTSFESRVKEMELELEKNVNSSVEGYRSTLREANLPMLFEAGETGVDGVPDETFARIVAIVHQDNGLHGLLESVEDNKTSNTALREVVQQCSEKLRTEEERDRSYRAKYGAKWALPVSSESNKLFKKDCLRYSGYLMEGLKNDNLLSAKLESGEVSSLLADVSLPKEHLDMLIPRTGAVDDDERVEALRSKVRLSYINFDEKLSEATKKLGLLKGRFIDASAQFVKKLSEIDDVSELLSSPDNLAAQIDISLASFADPISDLNRLVDSFPGLLSRVLDDSAKYMESRQTSSVMQKRINALNRLERGIVEFEKQKSYINEGRKFYIDLGVKIQNMKLLVDDYILSRNLVSDELGEALRKEVAANPGAKPNGFGAIGRQASMPILPQDTDKTLKRNEFATNNHSPNHPATAHNGYYGAVDSNGYPVMPQGGYYAPYPAPGYYPPGQGPPPMQWGPPYGYWPQPMPGQQPPGNQPNTTGQQPNGGNGNGQENKGYFHNLMNRRKGQ